MLPNCMVFYSFQMVIDGWELDKNCVKQKILKIYRADCNIITIIFKANRMSVDLVVHFK